MTAQEKLQKIRLANNVSMNRMAALLSTTAPTYRNWETSTRPPRKALECLSDLTGIGFATLDNDELDLPADKITLLSTPPEPKSVMSALADEDQQQQRWQQYLSEQVSRIGTQGEFAEVTGLETAQLSKFLTGKKRITLRTMFKVATVTKNYDWYTAPPADHEGERLRDYLEFHGIEQQELADRMGRVKSAISSLLGQRDIKRAKWAEISDVLGASREAILSNLTPNATYSNINEQQSTINYTLKTRRVRSAHMSLTDYVSVRIIQAPLRAGFNYAKMFDQLPTRQVPLHQLQRINAQLTPEQMQEQIERYDIIEIASNDHMEPGLRAGQQILSYRLYADSETLAYPAGRWSEESGPMAVETPNGRLFIGRVLENTLGHAQVLTLVKDDPRGGSATFQLDQIVNIWKLETYYGGPVV